MDLSTGRLGVNSRRCEIEIFTEMLKIAKNAVNKTTLLYQANLNYNQLQKYLTLLLERGLLEECGSSYRTTEKGREFLATFVKLQELLAGDSQQAHARVEGVENSSTPELEKAEKSA